MAASFFSKSFARSATTLASGAAVVGFLAFGAMTPSASAQSFSTSEREEIEQIVRDYLIENPQIILDVLNEIQRLQDVAETDRQRGAIVQNASALFENEFSPIAGNPDGDVVIVEFFDYNCGFCKRMLEPINELLATDDDLRIVFKEFPILSPSSVTAAQAALAAEQQGRYLDMHNALMGFRGQLTDEIVMQLAAEIGLDMDQLASDMESDEVREQIESNRLLAQQIGVRGTPALIVGEELIPGAIDLAQLQAMIEDLRG